METQTLAFIFLMATLITVAATRLITNYLEWKYEMKKLDLKEELKNAKTKQ